MFKVTYVFSKRGEESAPFQVEENGNGYVLLPELPKGADCYRVYAPPHGFEVTGPWHFWKLVSRRDARRARRTIAACYLDVELAAMAEYPSPPVTERPDQFLFLPGIPIGYVHAGYASASPKESQLGYDVLSASIVYEDILDAEVLE